MTEEQKKTVIPKVWEYDTEYIPNPLPGMSKFPDVDWKGLQIGLNENAVTHVRATFTEIVDWDMAPMTKFFHGVVVPAFQKKWNETIVNEETPYYSKTKTKEMLKGALLRSDDGFHVRHTADLTPQEYMEFINACERTYVNLFHENYDIREKPEL